MACSVRLCCNNFGHTRGSSHIEMDNETPVPPFPFAEIIRSAAVQRHLVSACRELALAAMEGVEAIKSHLTGMDLHSHYPYLGAALGNISATVEKLVQAVGKSQGAGPSQNRRRAGGKGHGAKGKNHGKPRTK